MGLILSRTHQKSRYIKRRHGLCWCHKCPSLQWILYALNMASISYTQAPLWLAKSNWFQILSRTHQKLRQGLRLYSHATLPWIPYASLNLDSFCVSYSIHRAIPFLPNPGYHPWGDEPVSFTSRWWCLQQYTYSRRIPLWNIQHDECLCRLVNRCMWYLKYFVVHAHICAVDSLIHSYNSVSYSVEVSQGI